MTKKNQPMVEASKPILDPTMTKVVGWTGEPPEGWVQSTADDTEMRLRQAEAWLAVADALNEVVPGWNDDARPAIEMAVETIRKLATPVDTPPQPDPVSDERFVPTAAEMLSSLEPLGDYARRMLKVDPCHEHRQAEGHIALAMAFLRRKVDQDLAKANITGGAA
jgi:hypothetical protein